MIPNMRVALILPEPLAVDRAFLRIHNRACKDALRDEAIKHWKDRIPGHFKDEARAKYGHMPRKPRYIAMKQRIFGRTTDLVLTGRTRTKMTREQPQIQLGGKASNTDGSIGALRLTMRLKFPFGAKAQAGIANKARQGIRHTGPRTAGVTIAQMRKEISKILPEEARAIANSFRAGYMRHLNKELASRPKIRKRISPAGRAAA